MDVENKEKSYRKCWFSVVVLFFSALNVIFLGGKRRAFGIFVAEFHHGEFNTTSLAELNWIGDSYAALGYMSTTITTAAILRFGRRYRWSQFIGACLILLACVTSSLITTPHWLFLTHTVLHGLGSSLILSTVGLIVNEYFDKNHPQHILATTLVSGGSVASIVFVQFYAYLIETYNWRNAFIILGVIYFVVNTSACIVFAKRKSKGSQGNQASKVSWSALCSIRKSNIPMLVLWTVDRMMTSIVTYGLLLNLADYLQRSEKTLIKSTLLTILFASGEACTYLIGAIVTGLTKNFFHNRLKYILLVSTFCMAVSLLLWEFVVHNKPLSHFLAFTSGLFLGPSITFLFPAGEEMTNLPGYMAYPFSLFGMGLGMAISPLLTALIAQIFDYRWFFMVQGCLIGIKFCCLAIGCVLLSRMKAKSLIIQETSTDKRLLLNDENSDSESDVNPAHLENQESDILTMIKSR